MGKYDDDDSKSYKGTVISVKKNRMIEKTNGDGEFKGHVLKIETDSGKKKTFNISVKARPAKYIAKLEEGEKIEVKTGGDFGGVVAVYTGKGGRRGAKTNRKEYDPTGAIQGMVLKSAVDIAIREAKDKAVDEDLIIEAAKVILGAKLKVDKLVAQAVKSKDSDDDAEDDNDDDEKEKDDDDAEGDDDSDADESDGSDADDDEDDDEEKPKKKKKRPY